MLRVADYQLFRQQFSQAVQEMTAQGRASLPVQLAGGAEFELALHTQEENVPAYTLPDPLTLPNGKRVQDVPTWRTVQRPRLLQIFAHEIYGATPAMDLDIAVEPLAYAENALNGLAMRKEVRIWFQRADKQADDARPADSHPGESRPYMDILLYLPMTAKDKPAPLFVGLNFMGNHTIHADPGIALSTNWIPDRSPDPAHPDGRVVNNRATAKARGTSASRWPVEMILRRGYGLATIYSGDLDPDFDDDFQNGVHLLGYGAGQTRPAAHEWGTVAAWAWGLQRAMDYFAQDAQIDAGRVALVGHSRLGKAALWAGAQDERFAAVISNDSGCMGAALTVRAFGETLASINLNFPHWFCENCKRYIHEPAALPLDQHLLLALIAPRPVYVASAVQDKWADPRGEFLALKAAESVYGLFGKAGLGVNDMPAVNQPVGDVMAYHVRAGGHDITAYDWAQYIDFCDRTIK
ncbi:MAG: hypothetical protein R2911_34795 [Caldilineaceae bacterium]